MAKSAELDTQSYWEDSASVSRYPALDRNLTVDAVVNENVHRTAAGLPGRSSLLSERLKAGTLKIYPARYDLDTGRVTPVP